MGPELGGDVGLRVDPPQLAIAHVQLDEQRCEQLSTPEPISSLPGVQQASKPQRWRRVRGAELVTLSEQPLALLGVLLGRDVAPLMALTDAFELGIDPAGCVGRAVGRRVGGGCKGLGNSLALG